jgi:hypothetical protein
VPNTFGAGVSLFGTSNVAANASPSFSKPSFGSAAKSPTSESAPAAPSSSFGGSSRTTGGSSFSTFANAAAGGSDFLTQSKEGTSDGSNKFSISGLGDPKNYKLFQGPPKSDSKSKQKDKEDNGDVADNESDNEAESFVPDAHYEPVIPLPALVEAKTGEEDEEVIFSARCKLYRFDKDIKENKERGLGDIKILRHPQTGKYRCVMRREKVLKLCANFAFVKDMKIAQKNNLPVYYWACKDFSEDTVNGSDEIFTARFKLDEVANDFSKKFLEASEKSGQAGESSSGSAQQEPRQNLAAKRQYAHPQAIASAGSASETVNKDEGNEYVEERGGYSDEDENASDEYQDEDDDEIILDATCDITLEEGYVSPLKASNAGNPAPVKCKLFISFVQNDRYRVWYEDLAEGDELFAHYIYKQTIFSQPSETVIEYQAAHANSGVNKRIKLRFDTADDASEVYDTLLEGLQLADENDVDQETETA